MSPSLTSFFLERLEEWVTLCRSKHAPKTTQQPLLYDSSDGIRKTAKQKKHLTLGAEKAVGGGPPWASKAGEIMRNFDDFYE